MAEEIEKLFNDIRHKYLSLQNSCMKKDFINSIRISILETKESLEFPEIDLDAVKFPDNIYIAYAVCHSKCGTKEFIVDGSTQKCQYCGNIMFRGPVKQYALNQNDDS